MFSIIPVRPTKEKSIRVHLQVNEKEDIVSFQIPSRNKAKLQHPHSLLSETEQERENTKLSFLSLFLNRSQILNHINCRWLGFATIRHA